MMFLGIFALVFCFWLIFALGAWLFFQWLAERIERRRMITRLDRAVQHMRRSL